MKWFAKYDVAVNGIEVSLKATIDKRKALGMSDGVPAGYQSVLYHVEVDSEVDKNRILEVTDEKDSHSPWLYNFTQPLTVTQDVIVIYRP